jgi:hypothetical protein
MEKMKKEVEERIENNKKKYEDNLENVFQADFDPFTKIEMLRDRIPEEDFAKLKKHYDAIDTEQEFATVNKTCKRQVDLANIKVNDPEPVYTKYKRQEELVKKIANGENVMKVYKSKLSLVRFIQDKILYFIVKNKMHKTIEILQSFTINTKSKFLDLDIDEGYFYLAPDLKIKIDIKQKNYKDLKSFTHPFNILFNRDLICIKQYLEGSFPYSKSFNLTKKVYDNIIRGEKMHDEITSSRLRIERISKLSVYEYEKYISHFAEKPVIRRTIGNLTPCIRQREITEFEDVSSSETITDSESDSEPEFIKKVFLCGVENATSETKLANIYDSRIRITKFNK